MDKKVFYIGLKVSAETKDDALVMADMILIKQYEQRGEVMPILEGYTSEELLIELATPKVGLIGDQSTAV